MIIGKKSWLRVLAICTTASCLPGLAPAQQSYDQWSIEALAAQARIVFRGTITNILQLPAPSKPGGPARVSLMLTVAVEENLKGRPDSWMTLMRDTVATDARYEAWMKSKASMLWFTFSEEDPRAFPGSQIGPGLGLQPGQSWTAVHLSPPDPAEIAIDPVAGQGTFSMDFRVLKEGKEKMEAVRRFLASNPDPVKVCRIPVPVSVTGAIGYPNGEQHLILPTSPELEPIALRMISTPEAYLPKDHAATEVTWVKADGVLSLVAAKSDKNVNLLKSLLTNPGKGPHEAADGPVRTLYWVRLFAYNVLTGWGVKVEKPTLN